MAVAVTPARAQTVPPTAAEARPTRQRSRLLQHWAGVGIYAALLVFWVVAKGLPLSRTSIAFWLILGMLAFTLHDVRRWIEGVMLEWLPFIAFLLLYDVARSYANLLMSTNVALPIDGDRLFFGGHVPSVWLQQQLWHGAGDVRWYDYAAWGVYMTYFFGTLVVAAGIWIFAYQRFRRFVAMVSLLSSLDSLRTSSSRPRLPGTQAPTGNSARHTASPASSGQTCSRAFRQSSSTARHSPTR